jgi:hypothetical protein
MMIVLPFGWMFSQRPAGIGAGSAAAGVCLLAASTSMALTARFTKRRPVPTEVWARRLLTQVWIGMSVRMGIPLFAALTVKIAGGPLADAGFIYYIVAFYPVTLAAEILVSRPDTGSNS